MAIIAKYTDFRYRWALGAPAGFDGREEWARIMVRANGFDGGITGTPRPITAFPITLTCNAGAVDGGAAYDWYLSQRTGDSLSQYLTMTQAAANKSGSVILSVSSLAVTELSLGSPTASLNEDNLISLLTDTWLFALRISDGSIQMLDLLRETLR